MASSGSTLIALFTRGVLRARVGLTLLVVLLIGVVGLGLRELRVDFAVSDFYAGNQAETQALESHVEFWGDGESTVVVVASAPEGRSVLEAEQLARLSELSNALASDPDIVGVRSIVNVKRILRPAPGVIFPAPLWKTRPTDPETAAQWDQSVLNDPSIVPALLSADGSMAALLVDLGVDTAKISEVRPVVDRLNERLAEHESGGMTYAAGGMAAVRAGILDVVVNDQLFFTSISFSFIIGLVIVTFRRMHGVIVALLAAILPTAALLSIMGFLGVSIGLINEVFLTLIPAIAAADAIHLIFRYHEELRARCGAENQPTPEQRTEAIVAACSHVGGAVLATTATTTVGFLSLNAAQMSVLRDYGTYAALGMVLSYLCFIVVLPLGLSFSGGTAPTAKETVGWFDRALDWASDVALRHRTAVILLTGGVVAVFIGFSTQVEVGYRLTAALPDGSDGAAANALVDEHLAGLISVDIALDAAPEKLASVEAIHAMDALTADLLTIPGVRLVNSVPFVLRAVSRQAGGSGALPEDDALPAVLQSTRERGLLRSVFAGDRARLTVRVRDRGLQDFQQIEAQVNARALATLRPVGLEPVLTGSTLSAYRGVAEVTSDLRRSLMVAFAVITMVMIGVFRSLRVALWSLPPNAIPLIVGYGLLGMTGWALEPAPALVFTLALGIAIDDTIHLIARYREERLAGRPWKEAVRRSMRASGRAIVLTTCILSLGLGVYVFSAFPGNRAFGAVGAAVMVTALVADVFFLTATLRFMEPFSGQGTPTEGSKS